MSLTLRESLAASPLPRLEARMLLQRVLGVSRTWLIAHDTDALPETSVQAFLSLQTRREQGEPVAYLLGEREFMGHRFLVGPGVLIPRPETELLVEQAQAALSHSSSPRVLDLGTGSGAIAVSIALALPTARVTATDASAQALAQARLNADKLGACVAFYQGDWYQALPPDAEP